MVHIHIFSYFVPPVSYHSYFIFMYSHSNISVRKIPVHF
ncbi:hypothetical protein EVA_11580 [gut metagenome]|uniref:Uncharacterized protein n=1 Tax=gut metagenome TaxID=749906 RepID=J9G0F0_9ZZZZ